MTPSLTLSLETIPDVARIRQLFGLGPMLSDADVADYAFQRQRAQGGSDALPFHLQRIVLVSCLLREAGRIEMLSLHDDAGEASLLTGLFALIERLKPLILAWDAERFIRPLLIGRAMLLDIDANVGWPAAAFGDVTTDAALFDLAAHLTLKEEPETRSPLADFARLAGIPAISGPDSVLAWQVWSSGATGDLQTGCERRVRMIYLVFLRLLQAQGRIKRVQRLAEEQLLCGNAGANQ